MSNLPARLEDVQSPRQLAKATRKQRRAELTLFEQGLKVRVAAEVEQIEAHALGEVIKTSLEEEISNLTWGLERAEGSRAIAELVSRKIDIQSRINDRRIAAKFGQGWR